jgi:hypothetical protein
LGGFEEGGVKGRKKSPCASVNSQEGRDLKLFNYLKKDKKHAIFATVNAPSNPAWPLGPLSTTGQRNAKNKPFYEIECPISRNGQRCKIAQDFL